MSYESLLERLAGREYNGYFTACCVFHNDHSPSMFVYPDGFRCKACGKRGSLHKLENAIGLDYRPNKSQVVLPQFRKWASTYGDVSDIAYHAHQYLVSHPQYGQYLKKRKMDKFIKPGMFGFIDGWITMPVKNQDDCVVDIVVRAINKPHIRYVLMKPDKTHEPYLYSPNWKRVQESKEIYCVFGIMDSWAIEDLGLPCVTGTAGKSVSVDQLKALGKFVTVVPDKGEERDAYHVSSALNWRGKVKELDYPLGIKDPDEVRTKFGNKFLLKLLEA